MDYGKGKYGDKAMYKGGLRLKSEVARANEEKRNAILKDYCRIKFTVCFT